MKYGKVPFLSEKTIAARLKLVQNRSQYDWKKIIYVDECNFCLFEGDIYYWKLPEEAPMYLKTTQQKAKFHVFAGIWFDGRTKLFFIEGNMDANYYQDILYKTIVRHGYHTHRTLLQDWAPPHKANSTKKFLRDNNFNLVEDYPASSPDINPIEKVWGWMKHRIQEKFPENKKQLKQAIKDTYFELRKEILQGFIGGIESVCMKIEESEGGNIFQ